MSFYDWVAAAARNAAPAGGGGGGGFDLASLLTPTVRGAGKDLGKGILEGKGLKGAAGSAAGKAGGAALGTAVAGPAGTAVGGAIGGKVGELAASLFGHHGQQNHMDIPMMPQAEHLDPGFLTTLLQSGMPGYARGTHDQPGGLAMVGELGPELAMLQPHTPVAPMDWSQQVGDYVDQPAEQMGQHSGWLAEIARAIGHDPFADQGALGGFMHEITGALPGRHHNAARIGLEGLGALGNILTNRELTSQSEVDKLNESLRARAATRNADLQKRGAEERATQSKIAVDKAKSKEDAAAKADEEAAKRRFVLSDKVASKIGLPSGTRVSFEEYTKALDSAKDKLPTNEFDRIVSASPAEWRSYVKRVGEKSTAENAGKPDAAAKGPTADQAKAAAFYGRAQKAVDAISKPEASGSSIEDRIAKQGAAEAIVGKALPQAAKGADRQRYEQSVRAFALALLRRESGAAISKSEFENVEKAFFAQPGDGPEVITQKQADRQAALDGLKNESGPGVRGDAGGDAEFDYVPGKGLVPVGG